MTLAELRIIFANHKHDGLGPLHCKMSDGLSGRITAVGVSYVQVMVGYGVKGNVFRYFPERIVKTWS